MSNTASDDLNYLGTFATIDEVYVVYPSGGVAGNFVIVNGNALYWNEASLRWMPQDGSSTDDSTVNGTLFAGELVLKDGFRTNDYQEGVQGSALRKTDGEWVLSVDDIRVRNDERFKGQSAFRMQVFTRSDDKPEAPTGGQYSDPQPDGMLWQEGVPQGSSPIWMSSRIYTSDGNYPQDDWSDPLMLIDSEDFDVEFSPHTADSTPASPSSSNLGTVWFDPKRNPDANWKKMNWVAMRYKSVNIHGVAEWGSWVILPTKGAKGADGDSYENVFYRTAQKVVPVPDITDNDIIYQFANYCPGVANKSQCGGASDSFTPDPRGISEDYPYEWVMQRRKRNGRWMQFSMPPVLFASYGKEHTISISDNGFWVIDGVETDKRAVGRDGNSVSVKGRVDVYSDEEKEDASQTSLQSYPASLDDLEVGDCWIVKSGEDGDENDISGHLFIYVGGSHVDWEDDWQDLGEFKGEKGDPGDDGHSEYLYLAWATNVHFAGNPQVFDYVEGYTTNPAEGQSYPWMGIMVSETEIADINNDRHAPDFKWNYLPGRDGTDFENVYIRTKVLVEPEISASEVNKNGYQNPEFLPDVDNDTDFIYTEGDDANNTIEGLKFTDDPNGISEDWPYEWQSRREKINGVWGPFQSPAVLHRNWSKGEKGDDGAGQAYVATTVDQIVVDCDSDGRPTAAVNQSFVASLKWGDETCALTPSRCTITENTVGSIQATYPFENGVKKSALIAYSINSSSSMPVLTSGLITISLTGVDGDNVEHTATKTVAIIANRKGANGANGTNGTNGTNGPSLRFLGPWVSTTRYVYNEEFRDCVKHGNGYYILSATTDSSGILTNAPNTDNRWTSMGGDMKFFATELLLAENGAINLLSSNVINLFNVSGVKTASINADGNGEYCIHYPSGGKRMTFSYDGYIHYYKEDGSEAWRIGLGGDIEKFTTDGFTSFPLCSLSGRSGDISQNDTFTLGNNYWRYRSGTNGLPQYDGKIYKSTGVPTNPATATVIPDGRYTPDTTPHQVQATMDSTAYAITVYVIEGGFIKQTLELTTL